MPSGLEPITEEELRPGDARRRLRTIRKLAAMYNAWLNPQVRSDTGKEDVKFSTSNVVIEYIRGSGTGTGSGDGSGSSTGTMVFAGMSAGALQYYNIPATLATDGTGAVNSP